MIIWTNDVDLSADAARKEMYRLWATVVLRAEGQFNAYTLLKREENIFAWSEGDCAHNMANTIAQPITKLRLSVRSLPAFSPDGDAGQDRQESAIEGELPIIHHKSHRAELLRDNDLQGVFKALGHLMISYEFIHSFGREYLA